MPLGKFFTFKKLLAAVSLLAVILVAPFRSAAFQENGIEPITPPEHRRSPDQTFLTYPEWFLVHSPAEYAHFLKDQNPSDFPFFGHIGQFWESYETVYSAIKDKYPPNVGYHVMIIVIGISTTIEYSIKSAYETLLGRLSELTRTHGMTEEDLLAARVAQEYVDFIRVIPWYEFDFAGKLEELWKETSLWGPDPFRKWERKYFLTSEYGAKAVYGWIIKKLTKIGYEAPIPVTTIVLDQLPPSLETMLPDLEILEILPGQSVLVTVPRYSAFKDHVLTLARNDVRFLEIAGNRTVIVVSVLVPIGWQPQSDNFQTLLQQPILTQPAIKRLVITTPVDKLHIVLNEFDGSQFRIEHVYDY